MRCHVRRVRLVPPKPIIPGTKTSGSEAVKPPKPGHRFATSEMIAMRMPASPPLLARYHIVSDHAASAECRQWLELGPSAEWLNGSRADDQFSVEDLLIRSVRLNQ